MVDNDGEEVTDIDLEQDLARQAEDTKMELAEIRKFYERKEFIEDFKR